MVAPTVDLSILGLLLGTRHLALHGATAEQLRPARRLLIFASLTTLALNIADPLVTCAYGKAAFDAVGHSCLSAGLRSGQGFLQAIGGQSHENAELARVGPMSLDDERTPRTGEADPKEKLVARQVRERRGLDSIPVELLARARHEDADHRAVHQRPISADTLRKRLRIAATRSRQLVAVIRSEAQVQADTVADDLDGASEGSIAQAA